MKAGGHLADGSWTSSPASFAESKREGVDVPYVGAGRVSEGVWPSPYDLNRETNAEARGGTGPSPAHQPTAASWRREPWSVSLWFCYHQILKNAGVRVV